MLPALSSVTKQVQRVQCASNLRQIGIGLQAYAYDADSRLPSTVFEFGDAASLQEMGLDRNAKDQVAPADTLIIRPEIASRDGIVYRWDGVGRLFGSQYINSPDVFYCPAHTGEHPIERYRERFGQRTGAIVSNYQYRVEAASQRIGFRGPTFTLAANGLRTKSDYSHIVGNNMLKADGAVTWFDDPQRTIYNSLPETPTASSKDDSPVPAAFEEMDERPLENLSQGPGGNPGY